MPGEPTEYAAFAAIETGRDGLRWDDGSEVTEAEYRDVLALRAYLARMRHHDRRRGPQRKAVALLRSFLSPAQRDRLRATGCFLVVLPSGRTYRIEPRFGFVERVTRQGSRWYADERYCLHDDQDDGKMPPADVSTAHMLLLLADETEFLRIANARTARDQLWNRAYLQRLREARRGA
jgi:hypothetical protein